MPTSDNLTATSQSQFSKSPLVEMETDEERWDDIEIPLSGLIVQGELDEMMIDNDDECKENRSRYHVNCNDGLSTTAGDILRAAIMGSDGNVGEIMQVSSNPPSLPKESSYDSRLLKNTKNYNTNNVDGDAKNKIRVGVSSKSNASSNSTVTKTNTISHASKQRRIIKEGTKTVKSIFCASELANFPVPKSTLSGNKEFTGTITRLGGESKKAVDMSDWDNDMEIPDTGLSLSDLVKTRSHISNKSNETDKIITNNDDHENFDNWDEEFQDFGPEEPCPPQSQNRNIVIKRVEEPTNEKIIESFDQDFDLLDADIDKLNLSTRALKVHSNGGEGCEESVDLFDSESIVTTAEIHSRNSSPASPSSGPQSEDEGFDDIQFPESMDSLRLLPHFHSTYQSSPQVRNEDSSSRDMNRSFDDDNDDWSGLEVQDVNVFEPVNLKHKNIVSRTVPAQQKRPRRESFTIEFSPPSLMQPATENLPNFTLDSPQIDCLSMMIDNPQSPGSSSSGESATKKQVRKDPVPSITRSTVSSSKKVTSHPKREVVASARIPPVTSSPCGYKPNTAASKSNVSLTPKEKGKSSATSNKKGSPKKSNSSVNITAGSIKENLNSLTLKHKKASSACSKSTCSDSSEKSARSLSLLSFSKSSTKDSKKSSPPSSSSSTSKKPFSLTSTKSSLDTKKSTANSKTSRPRPKLSSTTNTIGHSISQSTTKSQPKIRLFNNSVGDSLLIHKKNKMKEYGDGTELDGFDDLPISLERERDLKIYPASPVSPVFGVANNDNDNDVKESVFQNLSNLNDRKSSVSSSCSKESSKSSSTRKKNKRKKPQLIRNLNLENDVKVVGEMVYNPVLQKWDGNESVLKDFESPPTRPALITNMSPSTNTKSLQVVGDMVFDTKKMCWFHKGEISSEDEECLALFDLESDCEDNMPIKYHTTGGFAMDGHDRDNNELTFPSQPFSDDENLILGKGGQRRMLNRNVNSGEIRGMESGDNGFQVGSEFEVSKVFLKSLVASEKQHQKEMNRWYPAIRSISNEQRFGLKDNNFQKGFLYEIRKPAKADQSNTAKTHRKGSLSGLYSSFRDKSSRYHERPHFR